MNQYHQLILDSVKKEVKKRKQTSETSGYLGHKHIHYGLSSSQKREIAKSWVNNHKDISFQKFKELLDSLYKGKSYEEKSLAGMLLGYLPKLRKQLDPKLLDNWINYLEGWAEIDSTCQSIFTADELLSNWNRWKEFLRNLANSQNINKKRASLVLLTGPVRNSEDKRLTNLAFKNIEKLKIEKHILITKAISWLLRDLIKYHRDRVEIYLNENLESLPKIAVRETSNKIRTGKK